MKCPSCNSKVEFVSSAVDGAPLRLCSNAACDWEELPEPKTAHPDAEEHQFQSRYAPPIYKR